MASRLRSAALAVFTIVVLAQCGTAGGFKPYAAPPLAARTISGGRVDLAQMRSRPVLVLFGADWCLPCRRDWPLVQRQIVEHPDLRVVGVAYQTARSLMQRFVDEIDAKFPVADDRDGRIAEAWRVRGIPQSFFVDANGRVVSQLAGLPSESELERRVTQLLTPPS